LMSGAGGISRTGSPGAGAVLGAAAAGGAGAYGSGRNGANARYGQGQGQGAPRGPYAPGPGYADTGRPYNPSFPDDQYSQPSQPYAQTSASYSNSNMSTGYDSYRGGNQAAYPQDSYGQEGYADPYSPIDTPTQPQGGAFGIAPVGRRPVDRQFSDSSRPLMPSGPLDQPSYREPRQGRMQSPPIRQQDSYDSYRPQQGGYGDDGYAAPQQGPYGGGGNTAPPSYRTAPSNYGGQQGGGGGGYRGAAY
jgi:hypothetical protein